MVGQPRRHLLTTGWSAFVNKKKLVSGDAVLFLRYIMSYWCTKVFDTSTMPYGTRLNWLYLYSAAGVCFTWIQLAHYSPSK